jgi:undecaprenyl diphosphate synthase
MLKHLAIIMDGNRRWAKQKGVARWRGHQEGAKVIEYAINFCLEMNIKFLSLYTFSLENLKNRSKQEQDFLFDLLVDEAVKILKNAKEKSIKIKFIGDKSLFPERVLAAVNNLEIETQSFDKLQVNFLFMYGARQEIFFGIQELLKKIRYGEFKAEEVTPELFEKCLWTHNIPEPEVIIRTGGVKRLSNFLLYQAAYSEFFFLDIYWPEVRMEHLQKVYTEFGDTKRNFGV